MKREIDATRMAELIPYGHENGLTATDLCRLLNLDNRTVRELVAEVRKHELVLNLQDGKGYFKPDEDDIDLVEHWVNQEKSRRRKISQNIALARTYLGV